MIPGSNGVSESKRKRERRKRRKRNWLCQEPSIASCPIRECLKVSVLSANSSGLALEVFYFTE